MKTISQQFELAATVDYFNLAGETLTVSEPAKVLVEDTRTLEMFERPAITSRCPSWSPWDAIQHKKQIAPGIWSVSTAGHGGLWVAPELMKLAPSYLVADTNYSGGGWFEEDCDWALACAAFPSMFPARDCYFALHHADSANEYCGERWAKYRTTELYQVLKARAALHVEPTREEASATA